MGLKYRLHFKKKWLILGFLGSLIPLFQNMSSTDPERVGEYVDIRETAPRKPSGVWENPDAAYFPTGMTGSSLNEVGQKLLDHNFRDEAKLLEVSILGNEKRSFGGNFASGRPALVEPTRSLGKWNLGLISATKLRFSYETPQSLKFICEANSGEAGLNLKMSQALSSRLNFDFVHKTGDRQSQVQFDYRW